MVNQIRKCIFYCIFGILLAASFFSIAFAAAKKPAANPDAGVKYDTAADFTLKDLNGADVALGSFKGKKVLLVFGATWCQYCVREVEDLKAFYNRHKDKDVKLIYIDIQESLAKVSGFVKKHNIGYTVVIDTDGSVANKYGIYGIPTNILVDQTGAVKYKGGLPQGGLDSILK